MSGTGDKQDFDIVAGASATSARESEAPTELADSPTVRGVGSATPPVERDPSIATPAAPASGTEQPDLGVAATQSGETIARQERDSEATMTATKPGTTPGAPLGEGLAETEGDVAGDGSLRQADTGDRMRGAMESDLADMGGGVPSCDGTLAGLDETSGSDDLSAQARPDRDGQMPG